MDKIHILNLAFDNVNMDEASLRVAKALESKTKLKIATVNAEIAYLCEKDATALATIGAFDMVVCDGVGVLYASKIVGTPLKERVAGIELGERIISDIAASGHKLFLLGAAPGVAEDAAKKLCEKYTSLNICGTHDGYFKDDAHVIEQINNSGADVVFVCLGAPKQENWISANCDKLCASVFIGLGGSLDIYAGNSKRAPAFFCRFGLEWLYRLICQPWRIKRMMALPKYILRVIFRGKNINR
ncbi:MAG: WecB/TagA/CpsF family glycosyltransferase [Ruminococcaceae bacterium]|nr:WecB/TagA/CpsF family glycosyltransferase [Oscillospiraceae bacterium]